VKRLPFILLLALFLGSGCASRYVVTLNNGSQIATSTKPRVKNGRYVFKDVMGTDRTIPVGSVAEIAPASMTRQTRTMQYNPAGK
jgi:hypothetical protein